MIDHKSKATGQQLGNYRLTHLAGTGGFADVYLGEHLYLGTPAAIKVLHTKLTGDEVARFRQEARTIAHLIHPHIIRVLDFDVEDMTPFLVMDYIPGGTLRQKHPRGTRVPLPLVVEYVKQVADALHYAHNNKVVHRDVKPENMLIDQNGRIVLSDFGVASIAHSTESQTVVELAGTIAYIAPEQVQGLPRPASDQYALAVVVYEWITGERPFQGTFAEILSQHLVKEPPTLHSRIAGIAPALENVILKALAKDARDRFATVQDFATAFERAYQEQQHTALPELAEVEIDDLDAPTLLRPADETPVPEVEKVEEVVKSLRVERPALVGVSSLPGTSAAPRRLLHSLTSTGLFAISARSFQYLRPQWKFVVTMIALAFIVVFGGVLYTTTNAAPPGHSSDMGASIVPSRPLPTSTPTRAAPLPTKAPIIIQTVIVRVNTSPTVDANATNDALAASQATAAAVAAGQATAAAQATQGAIDKVNAANATATALATTPDGLYTLITSLPPTINDSLSAQSARGWTVDKYCSFTNGAYHATISQTGSFVYCMAAGTNFCNFAYRVQMTMLGGDGGGLIFRYGANQYRFRLGPDGSYDLVNANYTVKAGTGAVVKQGAANSLTVIARGSTMDLYVNGQHLTEVNDSTASCGSIGLMAVDFTHAADVAFSNAQVWML